MYLVDTKILSEARRGGMEARTWLRSVDPTNVYLSVVTIGEVMKGIALKARTDPHAAGILQIWLETLRQDYGSRILPVTDAVAMAWGRVAAGRTRGMADGLIAATAIVHQKILVTRNVGDFADIGVPMVNPWGR
jgi:predicted nucleic acid-binding protein